MTRTARRLLFPLLAVMLAIPACDAVSSNDRAGERDVSGGITQLGQQLPDRILAAREIRVGSDVSYAPAEFFDALAADVVDRPVGEADPPVRGFDRDLANELSRVLGVRFRFVNHGFDDLIPALQNGTFDVIISAMTATEERAQRISFIHYFEAGTSILVRKGNFDNVTSLADLCGKRVAVQGGTTMEDLVVAQQPKCPGDRPVDVRTFESGSEVLVQLKYLLADAALMDFPVAAYNAEVSGGGEDFEVVGEQVEPGAFGIGVRKDDGQLREVLVAALKEIIADGSYDQVLARWNVADGAVKTAEVVGAP